MQGQSYYAQGTRCVACGSDLGGHRVWTLIFSDDDSNIVADALHGSVNRVGCPQCKYKMGWLWPTPAFLFVDLTERRAVCVTLETDTQRQAAIVHAALRNSALPKRGVQADSFLRRTQIINDYRKMKHALSIPIAKVEQESASIFDSLERRTLNAGLRIERLVENIIKTGAVTLESDELTPELLTQIQAYQAAHRETEDHRVQQVLVQLAAELQKRHQLFQPAVAKLNQARARSHGGDRRIIDTLAAVAAATVDKHLRDATASALRHRIAFLCRLATRGALTSERAAAIDLRTELATQVDTLVSQAASLDAGSPTEVDRRALPAVRAFIATLQPQAVPKGLASPGSDFVGALPAWFARAELTLRQIENAKDRAPPPGAIVRAFAETPLAAAYVCSQLGGSLTDRDLLGLAMTYLGAAIDIVEQILRPSADTHEETAPRLHAVCLERVARLQIRFGRLEEASRLLNDARSLYEQIGALDGLRNTSRLEARIALAVGKLQDAEALYLRVIAESQGTGTTKEWEDMMGLAVVYHSAVAETATEMLPSANGDVGGDLRNSNGALPPASGDSISRKRGLRVTGTYRGGGVEFPVSDIINAEHVRLIYLATAIALLNGDRGRAQISMGQLILAYADADCGELAHEVFERLLSGSTIESCDRGAQLYALNRLEAIAALEAKAGNHEQARKTHEEELRLLEYVIGKDGGQFAAFRAEKGDLRVEKARLLEALNRNEAAAEQYREIIESLERARSWMADPDTKAGLQTGRWRPYVRAARNALRIYGRNATRTDMLIEAWSLAQASRSRVMLDLAAVAPANERSIDGVCSTRPYSYADLVTRLSSDTAVLEYVLFPEAVSCPGSWALFLIEPRGAAPSLIWQEHNLMCVFESQTRLQCIADRFDRALCEDGIRAATGPLTVEYMSALEGMSDVIIPAGLMDSLRARGYNRLVIIADAYLHRVPYAALRPIQSGERAYLGLPSSRSGFELVMAPSASIFASWASKPSREGSGGAQRAALFVDPLGDLSKGNSAVRDTFAAVAARLEARSVEITRFDGKSATPAAWLEAARGCDFVVYFGHGIALRGHQGRALAFSDGSDGIAPITAEHIYRTANLSTFTAQTLFVFASCSTGLLTSGGWDSDRELHGLSAAHLYAGGGAVIAASRPLLGAPTLIFLGMLVDRMLSGFDAAKSLATVQRDFAIAQSPYAHPHFWGYIGLMGLPGLRIAISATRVAQIDAEP